MIAVGSSDDILRFCETFDDRGEGQVLRLKPVRLLMGARAGDDDDHDQRDACRDHEPDQPDECRMDPHCSVAEMRLPGRAKRVSGYF